MHDDSGATPARPPATGRSVPYTEKNANGDAGQYLVAYTFTKLFRWPCRLYGVDIGVDAELEVLSESGDANGDIVKIQVKTVKSMRGKNHSVSVEKRHVQYWQNFCVPVIVCAVDLQSESVYWKQILPTDVYSRQKEGAKSQVVQFDLEKDKLTLASGRDIQKLVQPEGAKLLGSHLQELKDGVATLDFGNQLDFPAIDMTNAECDKLLALISRIEQIGYTFPWRYGTIAKGEVSNARVLIMRARSEADRVNNEIVNGG